MNSTKNSILPKFFTDNRVISFICLCVTITILAIWAVVSAQESRPYATFEPEHGSLTQGASVGSDSSASGGQYVQFSDAFAPPSCERWVATNGSNSNSGSQGSPWATLQYAVDNIPISGCAITVMPGMYADFDVRRRFTKEALIRSATPYKATIQSSSIVIDIKGDNVTLEGFEIKQAGTTGNNALIMISESSSGGSNYITIRNNIIHNSYDNDLLKPRGDGRYITIEGNVFYNPAASEQHIDINGIQDVVIQDNLFFNDYSGSGRSIPSGVKGFFVIKDSSGVGAEMGAGRINIRRNVMMNWQGGNEPFLQVGNDGKPYHEAFDIRIENNLLIGNSPISSAGALGANGAKNVFFVNNTVVGDLPSSQYLIRSVVKGDNPPNENIVLANNIFSDHTGTMSKLAGSIDTPGSVTLHSNLYWNNGNSFSTSGPLRVTDDSLRVIGNPLLNQNHSGIVLPRWNGNTFISGSTTIRQEFIRIVELYAPTGANSAAIGQADPAWAPDHDILQRSRGVSPDIGAWQR